MKKLMLFVLIIVIAISNGFSQKVVRLYEGKAPGSENWNYDEIKYLSPYFNKRCVRNVVDPTLEVFVPEKSIGTGTAVIICPGGGNYYLEYENEGTAVAEWLIKKGIAAFVLKYRVNKTPEPQEEFNKWVQDWSNQLGVIVTKRNNKPDSVSLAQSLFGDRFLGGEDGIKAMEYVREHASEYNIAPNKVGIMGFSAGAWLTTYVIMNSSPEQQPNFAAPIYGGSIDGKKVPENAPPLFIACAANDPIVNSGPTIYQEWRDAEKSVEMHIYSKGGHGFGMRKQGLPVDNWIEHLYDWIKVSGF